MLVLYKMNHVIRIPAFRYLARKQQSPYFLNPKFQASSHNLWVYCVICVGPGREPRRPIFLQRGSNTSSWPRKSCENIRASVTPKLSANAPLLCAQVYHRRKRNFCKMSANVIAPTKHERHCALMLKFCEKC